MPKVTNSQPKVRKASKIEPAPKSAASAAPSKKPAANPLFVARPKNFGVGNIQPKRDLTRFVRWPRYVLLQRQKRVLMKRLNVPPSVNQFSFTIEKDWAKRLFALLDKYRPEDKAQKKARLLARAAEVAKLPKGEAPKPGPKPHFVKHGLNHVTSLVESKRARFVVIAHDVDPLELVLWLPALCRKKGIPYCIVKSKSRLGQVVHKKKTAVLAITSVQKEDEAEVANLANMMKEFSAARESTRKLWGGGRLGRRSEAALNKRQRAIAKLQAH